MFLSRFGRIVVMSPPVDMGWLRQGGKVAYLLSKFGMTMIAHGLAQEVEGTGVSINALWPATFIESSASKYSMFCQNPRIVSCPVVRGGRNDVIASYAILTLFLVPSLFRCVRMLLYFLAENFKMSERREWRKADIVADALALMVGESAVSFNGRAVIDEEYLRAAGYGDFQKYRCDPTYEPKKVWPVPPAGYIGGAAKAPRPLGVPPGIQARL